MDALKDDIRVLRRDAREALGETMFHPAVDRVVGAIRERPVTAAAVAAALLFVGTRLAQRRHWQD